MYHTYLDNRYNEAQVSQMKAKDSPSRGHNDIISKTELETLQKMISKINWPEVGGTSKYSGASFSDPEGGILKEIFHGPLTKMIGDYELDFFAWQEAIIPWKIHADLRWYKDKIPYKAVLVPLDVESDDDAWKETYTIAFKQRNYLEGNIDSNTGEKGNTDQSTWKRPYDKPGMHYLKDGFKITTDEHKKYFSHMPYEYLEGLEIDNLYKWEPGGCVVWDQDQLHCADNFLANGITTKRSLIFFTNQA